MGRRGQMTNRDAARDLMLAAAGMLVAAEGLRRGVQFTALVRGRVDIFGVDSCLLLTVCVTALG